MYPAIIFSILLTIAVCYSLKKKRFEYLFISIYALLPDYYAIELSQSLPLITASRVLIGILVLYVCFHFSKDLPRVKTLFSPQNRLLLVYFILRILTNLYYCFTHTDSIKQLISICMGEMLLLFTFSLIFTTEEKTIKAIKLLINGSFFVFVLSIISSFFSFNIGNLIYTLTRSIPNEYYIRLGLMRAVFTFGMPAFLATYCIVLLPFIFYFYKITQKKFYFILLVLDCLTLIHTSCRAHLLFLVIVFMIGIIFSPSGTKKSVLKDIFSLVVTCFVIMLVLSCTNARLKYFYTGTAKSVLNEIGFDFDLNKGAPDGVTGYGKNLNGGHSRIRQFSGIPYALSINPLFGLGANAQNRKEIKYYRDDHWEAANSYDVGYVAVIADEGLLGLAAYTVLLIYTFIKLKQNKNTLNRVFLVSFLGYLTCLLANNLLNPTFWIIYSLFIASNQQNICKNL